MEPETIFKAMADRTRQRALALLSAHELSVSELVELLRQPQSTVSRHLKVLRESGLIHDRRDGATVLYSVPSGREAVNGTGLSDQLLGWVADQPLPSPLRHRLDAVIDRRRSDSDDFFARVGRHWDTLREESFGPCFHLEAMIALLPAEWTVADIGTGTGYFLPALAGHFQKAIGVDPVDEMLEAARQRISAHRLENAEVRMGDLSALPIEEGGVDLSLALLVLHHVPSPPAALAEFQRITSPGGHMLVVEQSAHRNEDFHHRMQDRWWGFEPGALADMLKNAGFESVRWHAMSGSDLAADAPELFVMTARRPETPNGTRPPVAGESNDKNETR